jgi:hypothetical protein
MRAVVHVSSYEYDLAAKHTWGAMGLLLLVTWVLGCITGCILAVENVEGNLPFIAKIQRKSSWLSSVVP